MDTLRIAYEQIDKEISDRQWRRIRKNLDIVGADPSDAKVIRLVRAYATLRRQNPRSAIGWMEVQQYMIFRDSFPDAQCKGSDLLDGINRVLEPVPSKETIRRWGREINCPFSENRWYTPDEVQKWMTKVLSRSRFKVVTKFPGMYKSAYKVGA